MEAFPLKAAGKMVWVDIGGGTARNLEYFPVDVLKKYFKTIIIVDISASLLEIAQRRVNAMGLQDIVKIVEHDVTTGSVFNFLPKKGTVDMITLSYSFTMIPDQKGAIKNATALLKSGGYIGIADFFLYGNYDACLSPFFRFVRYLESGFHKRWFAMDHIHLIEDDKMQFDGLEMIWDKRERGAVPFMPWLKPYHGVYIMKKQKS